MTFLFFILFVVSVIGVIRPYKSIPNGKRWNYGLAAIASFVAIGFSAPEQSQNATEAAEKPVGRVVSKPSPTKVEEDLGTRWVYDTQKDEMRGEVTQYAIVDSENSIKFDFPYGEQPATLTVRQNPQYGLNVIFSVPSGQILCHGFGDSYFNVKFDDGKIRKFNCNRASDGSSEVSFVSNPKQFLTALKTSKRTVIEAEFYQAGRQQYVFDSRGLIWEN